MQAIPPGPPKYIESVLEGSASELSVSIPASGRRVNRIGSKADVDKLVTTLIFSCKVPQL